MQEGISLNSMVNRALRRYVVWDANASRLDCVALAGASLRKILTYLSDEEVREFARWVAENSLRDFVTFFYGEVTLDTVLKGERLLGEYGGHFQYKESVRDRARTVVLKHGRGMKWSIYYEEQLRYEVENLLGGKVETERTESQVTLRFPLPPGSEPGRESMLP